MDLLDLQTADAPVWFALPDPITGVVLLGTAGAPVRFALHSPDSKVLRDDDNVWGQRMLTAASRGKSVNLTAAEVDERATHRAVIAIANWENLSSGGADLPFSTENAKGVVSNPRLRWIRDWITEKVAERGNFIGAPAPTPSE